jgi:hypothetical protein
MSTGSAVFVMFVGFLIFMLWSFIPTWLIAVVFCLCLLGGGDKE